MRRCGHLLSFQSSSPATINKPLTLIRRCNNYGGSHGEKEEHGIDQERAPSTADEFRRVAQEKATATGSSAEAAEKDAAAQETDLGSVKEDYEGTQSKAGDLRRTGSKSQPNNIH